MSDAVELGATTRRSLLFAPGDRPDLIASAVRSEADAIIVDLEDAVRPERRAVAREGLRSALDAAALPIVVRVNAFGSADYAADVDAALDAAVAGIMLAKFVPGEPSAGLDDDLDARERQFGRPAPVPVIGLIESAAGVMALTSGAAISARITQLAWGTADLHLDVALSPRSTGGIAEFAMAALVLASRAAGLLPPLDSPCLVVDREVSGPGVRLLADEVERARALGFSGKLCIHPRQLSVVNHAFSPNADELAWARAVIAAWDDPSRAERGAITVAGQLVDEPIVRRAVQLLGGKLPPSNQS